MKLFAILSLLIALCPTVLWAVCSGSSPSWSCTADTSAADIQTCINGATVGDTVNIGAGSGTWTTQLSITKSIKIMGAGQGITNITNSYHLGSACTGAASSSQYLISIVPLAPSDNPIIRISGMTINFDGENSCGIYYSNASTTSDLTNVRLDHLTLSKSGFVLVRRGLAHGVMDNCAITGNLDIAGTVGLWGANNSVAAYGFGTSSNFYFEDNTWTPYSNSSDFYQAGNGDGRFAWRYNTITLPTGHTVSPLWDQHGNQSSAAGCFGAEIYGNSITQNYSTGTTVIYKQRGGKSLFFGNSVAYSGGVSIGDNSLQEEHLDSEATYPTQVYNNQPQHVSSSYYWLNRKNSDVLPGTPSISEGYYLYYESLIRNVPLEGYDVWNEVASFDGTSGVGCGTLNARPATCTTGVGYWSTNQSCSDLTGMIGASPSTPIVGTLYKCTATDTWTEYYTPYAYPHPLRDDADVTDPTIAAFSLAWSSGLTATVTFTATDGVALHATPYCVSETNDADDCTWEASAPETHTWTTPGLKTLYAFARDAAGNISDSSSTTVNLPYKMPWITSP